MEPLSLQLITSAMRSLLLQLVASAMELLLLQLIASAIEPLLLQLIVSATRLCGHLHYGILIAPAMESKSLLLWDLDCLCYKILVASDTWDHRRVCYIRTRLLCRTFIASVVVSTMLPYYIVSITWCLLLLVGCLHYVILLLPQLVTSATRDLSCFHYIGPWLLPLYIVSMPFDTLALLRPSLQNRPSSKVRTCIAFR